MALHWLFLIICVICSIPTAELVQVTVVQGVLEGELLDTIMGDEQYYSFKGIPYATPPTGSLRFKAPLPPVTWDGVRNATAHGSMCPQIDLFTGLKIEGDEDCLFLNVYSPNISSDTLLPVMFFIHGGGFKSGSGNVDSYGPDFLVPHGVVLVTINYRLAVYGFLSLDTEDVPGNAGLKDQVAALRWVQENIKSFGGDPNNVTIFGQSAGGASVSYHILSPMSQGLFKRAIAMSGVPFCDFAVPVQPIERAFGLGKNLSLDTNDTSVLLDFLQSVSSDELLDASPYSDSEDSEDVFIEENVLKMFDFVPVIEKYFGNDSFLTVDPREIMKNGSINEVDIMMGYMSEEVLTVIDTIVTSYLEEYNKYPKALVPTKILVKYDKELNLNVSQMVHEYYFENNTIDVNSLKKFIQYANEASFIYDINRFIAMLPTLSDNTRYLYKFSTVSDRNYYGNQGLEYNITGASHLDDTLYLFDAKSLNLTVIKNSTEYNLISRICTLFTNFAKCGNPTPNDDLDVQWPQYNNTTKNYMDIGNTLTTSTDPDAEASIFWKKVLEYAGLSFYY